MKTAKECGIDGHTKHYFAIETLAEVTVRGRLMYCVQYIHRTQESAQKNLAFIKQRDLSARLRKITHKTACNLMMYMQSYVIE